MTPGLQEAARIAMPNRSRSRTDESVLIVTNPDPEVAAISRALYVAATAAGGRPVWFSQPVKTQMDFAEETVIAAFGASPDGLHLGQRRKTRQRPGPHRETLRVDGKSWNHLFHFQLYGAKNVQVPSGRRAPPWKSFVRTVPSTTPLLKRRSAAIKATLDAAVSVRVTALRAPDVLVGMRGREAKWIDGDLLGRQVRGGNLPAGETFISPENGTASGRSSLTARISLHDGDILIREPIVCTLVDGLHQRYRRRAGGRGPAGGRGLGWNGSLRLREDGRLSAGSGAELRTRTRAPSESRHRAQSAATITGNIAGRREGLSGLAISP
jgi:hypothetical protein